MKVIAFNGSPKKNGNTACLINHVLQELENVDIATEHIHLGTNPMQGCLGCGKCRENKNKKCIIDSDLINTWIGKIIEADGVILGSPTYFGDVTSNLKVFIDRVGYVAKSNDCLFKNKIGVGIVAVARCGAIHALNSINQLFLTNQMIIPGAIYWNLGIGRNPGEVEKDEKGIMTMVDLGKNIAWLLKKINS